MNAKPIMFEFPEKSGVFHNSSQSINEIIENWTPRLAAMHFRFKQLGWSQYEIIDRLAEAKLKALGWHSPQDLGKENI